ncbi:MAG: hypothetical protein ACO1SX_15845, partial [Actinomycetota bacterium]
GAAALVWPQWLALDGARTALAIQQEREQEFEDRLETLRAMNERLRDWQQDGRRVFLRPELTSFGRVVQQVARREGSQVAKVQVTSQPSSRWRSVSMRQFAGDDQSEATGEIQPRSVRVVLTGSFDSVYRTVASLTRQQQLFLPERWDIAPATAGADAGGALRAEVWATVFAVQEPEAKPAAPVNSGPVAANVKLEEVQ